jgi:hypothetical protein
MSRTFLPAWNQMFDGISHRGLFRLFKEEPFRMIPGKQRFSDSLSAIKAAQAHVETILNPRLRAEKAEAPADPLGLAAWQEQRAGQAAEDQQQAFGAVIIKGRQIPVERRRRA